MNGKSLTVLLIALALLVVGCGSSPADSSSLAGTRWVLSSLGGQAPLPGAAPSLEFAADQINGSAGCNTYFGAYEASGGDLTIGDVAHTEMWCMEPEGVMDQEQAFLAALAAVTGYHLADGRLELLDGAGAAVLTFEPRAAEP